MIKFEKLLRVLVSSPENVKLDSEITDIINEFGIPAHLKGYKYVRYAIKVAILVPESMHRVTKDLYPVVGEHFATSGSRVERAIRHAIECGWNKEDNDLIHKYFGNSVDKEKGKPTNSHFIATIADYLELKRKDIKL